MNQVVHVKFHVRSKGSPSGAMNGTIPYASTSLSPTAKAGRVRVVCSVVCFHRVQRPATDAKTDAL